MRGAYLSQLWGSVLKSFGWSAPNEEMLLAQYEQAVDAMPVDTRLIFLMHCVQELNYSAIARDRGISVDDVEQQLIDALRIVVSHVPDPLA